MARESLRVQVAHLLFGQTGHLSRWRWLLCHGAPQSGEAAGKATGELLNYRVRSARHSSLLCKRMYSPALRSVLWCMCFSRMAVRMLLTGILPSAINACTLALIDAGIPMQDYVTALSCGLYSSTVMLDLNAMEEADLPHLVLAAMPRTGRVPLLQLDTRVHVERCNNMVALAVEAARVISYEVDAAVRQRTGRLVDAMHAGGPARSDLMDSRN